MKTCWKIDIAAIELPEYDHRNQFTARLTFFIGIYDEN